MLYRRKNEKDSSNINGGYFGCFQDNGSYERGWFIGNDNKKFCFSLASTKTNVLTYMSGGDEIQKNKWYSLLATYDGETMKLFIDGELKASSSAQQGDIIYPDDEETYFQIGSYKDANEDFRNEGALDEIKVWDRALSDDEISELFNATSIDKTLANNVVDVYPNPSKGVFNIELKNVTNASYKVYSLSGVEVQNGVISSKNTQLKIKEKGTYILKINTNKKVSVSKIIVK